MRSEFYVIGASIMCSTLVDPGGGAGGGQEGAGRSVYVPLFIAVHLPFPFWECASPVLPCTNTPIFDTLDPPLVLNFCESFARNLANSLHFRMLVDSKVPFVSCLQLEKRLKIIT